MMALTKPRRIFLCFALAAFGLPFLFLGLVLTFFMSNVARNSAARVERLQPISASALAQSPAGREVLFEGRVDSANSIVYRSFVAYIHEHQSYDGKNGTHWSPVKSASPPLLIDLADGQTRLAPTKFELRYLPTIEREGDERYSGFSAGDPIMVVGVTTGDSGGRTIVEADFATGKTRAEYVEMLDASSGVTRGLGTGCLGIFFVFLLASALAGFLTVSRPEKAAS